MILKFINQHGKEQVADSAAQLIAAVRNGELSSDTLVFNEQEQRWQKASELVEVVATGSDDHPALADTDPSQAIGDGTKDRETGSAPPVERERRPRTPLPSLISRWARNGPTLYCITAGLGYALVQNISTLVRDEYIRLAVDLLGVVGVVVGVRGLFRRKKTAANWERVVAGCVLLSVVAVPLAVTYKARKQKELVMLTHSRLQDLMQHLDAEVNAAGIPAVFQMLGGQAGFNESKLRETRTHIDGLIAALEKTTVTAKGYIQECRDDLQDTDPNSIFLKNLSDSLSRASSVRRDYFLEIGALLDFLVNSTGKYNVTTQGVVFQALKNADTYNVLIGKTVKYEEQLEAIAAEMKTGGAGRIVPKTCSDPHERVGQSGVCWCEPGYKQDWTSMKCVKE